MTSEVGADTTAHAGDDTGGEVAPSPRGREQSSIGRYRVGDRLGAGGMGVVYLAHDPVLDRQVAIKVLRSGRRDRGHLEREAQAIARIHHPNVVTVHDVVSDGGDVCVVMQYVRGTTLSEWLAEPARPPREILARFVAAGRGLAAAHAVGLVHRDFKPENVLLGDDGAVVVTDFGLARLDASSHEDLGEGSDEQLAQTRSGSLSGTPRYMSPEQFRGDLIDGRSDQFNFAVALWMALFGTHPIIPATSQPTLEQYRTLVARGTILAPRDGRVVSSRVTAALRRALATDPGLRFAAMGPFLDELAPRRRVRMVMTAAAVTAVAGLALVAASGRGADGRGQPAIAPPGPMCAAAGESMATTWSADARQRYLARAAEREDLAPLLAADAAAFDQLAASWTEVATADCRASDPRRAACLVDLRDQLAAALERPSLRGQPTVGDPRWCERGGVHLRERVLRTSNGSAAFSPDGQQIVYATSDGARTIVGLDGNTRASGPAMKRIWDWTEDGIEGIDADGKPVRAQPGEPPVPMPAEPQAGEVSHAGDRWARRNDTAVEVVDAAGKVLHHIEVPFLADVRSWSPDDRRLLVNGRGLIVIDLASGTLSELSRIDHHTIGYSSGVWRHADELLVAGSPKTGLGDGLWRVRLGDGAAIRDIAAVVPAVRNRGLAVLDVTGTRVLLDRNLLSFGTTRVHDGVGTPTAAPAEGVLLGTDVASGRFAIGAEDGIVHLSDGDGRLLASAHARVAALRGGELVEVTVGSGGRLELRRAEGALIAAVEVGATDVRRLVCNPFTAGICVAAVVTADGARLVPFGPDGAGRALPFTMPAYFTSIDVSRDGKRALVTTNEQSFELWELASGTHATVAVGDCLVQKAIFPALGNDVIIAGICRSALGREYQLRAVDRRGRTRVLYTGPDWISGVDHGRNGDLMISTRGFTSELVLLDGLPP